jgi:hypothetical protein
VGEKVNDFGLYRLFADYGAPEVSGSGGPGVSPKTPRNGGKFAVGSRSGHGFSGVADYPCVTTSRETLQALQLVTRAGENMRHVDEDKRWEIVQSGGF